LPTLRQLLDTVDAARPRPKQVVVVVDRDRQLAATLVAELEPRNVQVVLSEAGGNSAARNIGWNMAETAFVVFVDDDAVVSPNWLSELLYVAQAAPADIVGGRIDPRWPEQTPAWYSARIGWVVGCSYRGLPTRVAEVDRVISCNMLVRRDLSNLIGGFDSRIGRTGNLLGSEDTELCVRARRAGARIMFTPASVVHQIVPMDRTRPSYAIRRAWGEGRSKAALERLHPRALGQERRYARLVIGDIARWTSSAVRNLSVTDAKPAAMLAGVFLTTGVGYSLQRIADRFRTAAPSRREGGQADIASLSAGNPQEQRL
jgi:GT2 family glycosyltransferase